MSGLQPHGERPVNGVDVREQGNALRVATNTPHLVSLGTGRLSTGVTLHPIKQGRVTIGTDPTCDIHVVGTGVSNLHCRVENSHGVVTLYPINGSTLLDGLPVEKPTRLSQGSMLTIGRSNYLRFNHPEEAKLMKSVLPSAHISMAPIQFQPNEQCMVAQSDFTSHSLPNNQCFQSYHQKTYKDKNTLSSLDQELDLSLKELCRKKPPAIPKKPYRDLDYSDSNSDAESQKPQKISSIMAKVSKFEYYAKSQQKSVGRSQFYTTETTSDIISPKVFSANSLTVNTPAKDVLGGKNVPTNYIVNKENYQKANVNENNIDSRNCSYVNVAIRKTNKIDDIVKNFDDNRNGDVKALKKVNNDEQNKNESIYGKINKDRYDVNEKKLNIDIDEFQSNKTENIYGKVNQRNLNLREFSTPSPSFNRNPEYVPVYNPPGNHLDRSVEAEAKRLQAHQNRIKEEEQKQAETARLEEILSMCAEYEKQIASGVPVTPTEKRSQNKIITNGSLPRSVVLNNPNIVQTSDGYYKFDTSHNRNNSLNKSCLMQRNVSSYENFDISQMSMSSTLDSPLTPEVTIRNQNLVGRMDEIGIPVFEETNSPKNLPTAELSSPILVRKMRNYHQNGDLPKIPLNLTTSSSPYENTYLNRNNVYSNLKPKSPNTQSPRTRIKTTYAHKNLPSPQYFIFPTPPPVDDDSSKKLPGSPGLDKKFDDKHVNKDTKDNTKSSQENFGGIEKQLSLEEEIPMIDDSNLTDDIEFRYSRIISDSKEPDNKTNNVDPKVEIENDKMTRNKSFEDIKKELMADIPELDEFERELKEKNRQKLIDNITDGIQTVVVETKTIAVEYPEETENLEDVKSKYDSLKEERRKYVAEIHEIKCKMAEIRSQEDDILRELEMEKALIKGEYDSEIAILNIEQKKKVDLADKARRVEEDIRRLKEKQEARQNEMRDRVEIATLKVQRIEKDIRGDSATVEELQNAQDILDNETKIYEDLEFQHLEEESEMLAYREDLQNEIIVLTKKIEAQKSRILNLKSEANSNLTSALDETKILQAEYVRLLNQVEELTGKVQNTERELKPLVSKLNDIERTQSPDSAFYTDQTRAKSGEFGYSPQSSDSDDIDLSKITNYDDHRQQLRDKFNSIDQMSQSMIVDIERRDITDLLDDVTMNDSMDHSVSLDSSQKSERYSESPSKSSNSSKEKKGFWERNFDSLSRLKKDKKSKTSPVKVDIMSQSLNENMFYNSDNIESECDIDKFNSLRLSKSKKDKKSENAPTKSSSSSKIPTFAALGKIMKRDSFGKKSKENGFTPTEESCDETKTKNRYVKNPKPASDNKYIRAKSQSPDKIKEKNEEVELKEDSPNQKGHNVTFEELVRKTSIDNKSNTEGFPVKKIVHRKSCGDEPGLKSSHMPKIIDSGKIPSQDDIDRISKVTLDAPILGSDADMNSLGRRTLDSLMEIERNRVVMLEEQGCQVMENEREKISELKRRMQNEARKLWDEKTKSQEVESQESPTSLQNCANCPNDQEVPEHSVEKESRIKALNEVSINELSGQDSFYDREHQFEDTSMMEDQFNMTNSMYEDSTGMVSSSIEELQTRDSRTDSLGSRPHDDSRPLSHVSDTSRERAPGVSSGRAARRTTSELQRPLTRYLPVDRDDFDLRRHIETAGHQVELCPHVIVNSTSCRGYLHKLGAKFHTWSKRWFVFDRDTKTFVYYWDKSEKKPRGGAYFQVIEEVYLDHGNQSKSPNPQNTFVVKTRQRRYYLMSPSGEAARIWIDVIFTGAQGYNQYLE